MVEPHEQSRPAGKALLDVLNGREPWRRPVWLMRQAGRYLPEYRETRSQAGSFLKLCMSPELSCEVTLQPLRRYDLDAAIVFADILLVPWALGVDLDYRENEGPVLSRVSDMEGVKRLSREVRSERLDPVCETLRLLRPALPGHVTLIGFCGAPWTVASYMIEGGSSPDRLRARRTALAREAWFEALIERLVEVSADYLEAQVKSGADALQIFDSWAGDLDDRLQEHCSIRPIRAIVERLRARGCDVPIIGFARGIGAGHLRFQGETGVAAVGVESSVPISWMNQELGRHSPVQGNLDPVVLSLGGEALEAATRALVQGMPPDRHIFNLGHGIRQETSPEHVERMLRVIRASDG
ncbi:MAG: uroporphyrinogen decarboxylase [Parvibaculaceae bacterium]